MILKRTQSLFFSPTGTTQLIIKEIGNGMGLSSQSFFDISSFQDRKNLEIDLKHTDFCIVGAPIYMGRIPSVFIDFISKLKGFGVPTCCIVMYGNRAYDNGLSELKHILEERSFNVIGAGAFIGEHSFSCDKNPIAKGRPDKEDLKKAFDFGLNLKRKLIDNRNLQIEDSIPGKPSPKIRIKLPLMAPVFNMEKCGLCLKCKENCPNDAILFQKELKADKAKCILCNRCLKNCPEQAISFPQFLINGTGLALSFLYKKRKEPQLFL